MNKYIFVNYDDPSGSTLYQVSTPTIKEAIQSYSKANNLSLEDMRGAAENDLLTLFSMVSPESPKGYLTQFDLLDYLEDLDLELFLEDPYKYITHLLENARILLDKEPKIQDPDSPEYEITFTFFNYLLGYLLYHAPQKDDNHLIIRYYPSKNTLYVPEYNKEPKENLNNVNRVYSINYNSYITIHILVYKN